MVDRSKLRTELKNWEETVIADSRRMHLDTYDGVDLLPSLFTGCLTVGSINYQLNNLERTRLWFAWAVRSAAELIPAIDPESQRDRRVGAPLYAENAVLRAIIIGQPRLRRLAVDSVDDLHPELAAAVDWDPRFHMTRAFVAVATDDREQAVTHIGTLRDRARDLPDDDAAWRRYYLTLADLLDALVARETDTIGSEIGTLLDRHDTVAREKHDCTHVMDHRSAALVVLARERGLPVDPDDHEYLPLDLIDLVEPRS